jgi:hypothetical protein
VFGNPTIDSLAGNMISCLWTYVLLFNDNSLVPWDQNHLSLPIWGVVTFVTCSSLLELAVPGVIAPLPRTTEIGDTMLMFSLERQSIESQTGSMPEGGESWLSVSGRHVVFGHLMPVQGTVTFAATGRSVLASARLSASSLSPLVVLFECDSP